MKKLSLVLAIFLGLGVAVPLLAQEDSNVGGIRSEFEAKRLEILRKIEENRTKLEENRQKIENNLNSQESVGVENRVAREEKSESEENKSENSRSRWNNIKVRADVSVRIFEATLVRLRTLVERFDSRIDKLDDKGADTIEAVSFVDAAEVNLGNAEMHIENIKNIDLSYSSSTASTTASTTGSIGTTNVATTTIQLNFDQLKEEAKMAREELVEAKQNLMKALNVLKRVKNNLESNATSTLDIEDDNDDD
ncbi:MAG: hypothetical protein ACYCY6_00820 [Minisyncoccota bacterium]